MTTAPTPTRPRTRTRIAAACRTVTEAPAFSLSVLTAILLNAALLGAETYHGFAAEHAAQLRGAEQGCLAFFTLEMLLRLGAHADRPKDFWRDGWNIFDLVVVVCAYLPVVRENTTVLRLLRMVRVLRTARFLPQLRILFIAVSRSLPGTVSFLFVGAVILYVYAMVGWVCFGSHDPAHFGSLGRALLTLFLLMTLEGLGDAIYNGLAISRLSILYYGSYVLLASFVLVNVLIGVVLTSLDEARELDTAALDATGRAPRTGGAGTGAGTGTAPVAAPVEMDSGELAERIAGMRQALDVLEQSLTARPPASREQDRMTAIA
ncbi:ion transporter [Streptomyces sp. NPDC035033]|uniref:ion transporter n=1 Tax=Streptomyces sp. NPDC035033 TaxID=3155368 RepID=UPI0034068E89